MKILVMLIAVFTMIAVASAHVYAQEFEIQPAPPKPARPKVAVFASERLNGAWIRSFVQSLSKDGLSINECEAAIGEELRAKGFDEINMELDDEEFAEARKLKGVFGRYADVSVMPNDTAVRAASILDDSARFIVACRVMADAGGEMSSAFMYSCCANASCKVVDSKTRRRVATAMDSVCLPHANRVTGSINAVKDVCRKIGAKVARDISDRYSATGGSLK